MIRTILLSLLLTTTSLVGCTDFSGEDCEYEVHGVVLEGDLIADGSCFPMSGEEFARMISEEGIFNGYVLASEYTGSFSLWATEITIVDGIEVVNSWGIAKNETIGLRHVWHNLRIGGNLVADYEIFDGMADIYFSESGLGYLRGRDMSPEYEDPFVEILRLSQQDPDGVWPPFYYDFSALEGQSWVVTGDVDYLYQVGRTLLGGGSEGAREIYVQTTGFPPIIQGIGIYSDTLSEPFYEMNWDVGGGQDSLYYALQDGTIEENWFAEGYIPKQSFDRAPIPFIPLPQFQQIDNGITEVSGSVPGAMIHEVNLSEVEMHAFIDNSSVVSLMLDEAFSNFTSEDGTWWELSWDDSGLEGLLSHMDSYSVRTNSTAIFDIRLFDHWAQAWTDHRG